MKNRFLGEVGSLKQTLRTSNLRFLIFLSAVAFTAYSLPNHAKNDARLGPMPAARNLKISLCLNFCVGPT